MSEMKFDSYKALAASPEVQARFLGDVLKGIDNGQMKEGENLAGYMKRTIEVGGKPFSQVDHLTALERESDGWDFEDTRPEVKEQLARNAFALRDKDPGYDIPHFVYGFQAVVDELREKGVDLDRRAELPKVERDEPYPVASHLGDSPEP